MASAAAAKKKHVRFASMAEQQQQEEDDNDEQEEDTLFDKRKDASRGHRGALKAEADKRASRGSGSAAEARVEVVGAARGGTCGRWMITLALCASFLGLGMSISVLGPTFEDLAMNVNKNISNLSYIFVGRSAGYIGGSLLGGALFDIMNPHLLLGFSMLTTAFGMCAIPFCKQALLLTGLMSVIGMSMGVLDTGGNVLILNTWADQAGPHMQALHFSFAAGAFASPIIAKLLFGPDVVGGNAVASAATRSNSTVNSTATSAAVEHVTTALVTTAPEAHRMMHSVHSTLRSMWAYIVIGSFILLVSLLFFVLYSRGWGRGRDKAQAADSAPGSGSGKPLVAKHHAALILLLFFFFFGYVGAEVAYGSFIFTYAKDYAGMAPPQAAGLNSLFWGTFAACRGLAIFFAACVSPGAMILLSLVGSTVSSLLLCLFSRQQVALWVCTGVYGASMATTFPSGISWVEQYTTVTGRSAAAFVVGAALGEMVLPVLVGFLLGRFPQHPLLMYLSLLTATFTSILFPVMYKLATPPGGPPGRKLRARGRRGGRGGGGGRGDADDSEYRQALLDSGGGDEEEEEEQEEEEEENEADQWNDADFEVIEMDDSAGLIASPSRAPPTPDVAGLSASLGSPSRQPVGGAPSAGAALLAAESPRRKLLMSLNREKKD